MVERACGCALESPVLHLLLVFSDGILSCRFAKLIIPSGHVNFTLMAAVIALSHSTPVYADSNGMDMSMDGAMDLASGAMKPYLHFTLGDRLWFQGWVPQNAGAMVGACIGLFLLAIVERWIGACRSLMEAHWRKKYVFQLRW